ncbi:MAG: hypothetical protein Q9186_005542 [Xanthomendoza sp. 1 TL-2023]
MEHAAFHVVYVDQRISADLDGKYLHNAGLELLSRPDRPLKADRRSDPFRQISSENTMVQDNLRTLLSCFDGVHLCTSGNSCLAKLSRIESGVLDLQPILVIVEAQIALEARRADDHSKYTHRASPSDKQSSKSQPMPPFAKQNLPLQDPNLLKAITSQVAQTDSSTLIVPVAFIESLEVVTHTGRQRQSPADQSLLPQEMLRCLDEGAVDVLFAPLSFDGVRIVASHVYRLRKDKSEKRAAASEARKSRKRSWVGFDDRKPYAYLREEMVSGLMTGICSPEETQPLFDSNSLDDDYTEDSKLAVAFTSWNFSAHELSEDQLVHTAFLMIQHALSMAELERWRISAADLKSFLFASRAAYNSFVHYHNFRHVVDVMQAIFYFLLRLGTLPPYPHISKSSFAPLSLPKSPIGKLLQPFDALTLLVSAIGHDVGHPGVNNAFLVALNAPLAQLYNDKSVLESFHCAAYSQILRRYWKSVFEDSAMRGLMINSILATDMGLHFKYMADLSKLQEKVTHDQGTEDWPRQVVDEYRTLACGLLIKCADISNVVGLTSSAWVGQFPLTLLQARPFSIAAQWADILQLEFANQGTMENELGMSTTLFGGPPELGNITKLANSQNGFMTIFACPLFGAMSDILPAMSFAVDEMKANQNIWQMKVEQQKPVEEQKKSLSSEHLVSPRSGSPSRSSSQPELSHPEGLPASQVSSYIPARGGSSTRQESDEPRRASLASGPVRSSDPGSQMHSQDSRRSSLGAPFGYSSSTIDPTSYSRRSSGAYSAGHGISQSLTTRRSSNTSPSQLQLALAPDSRSQYHPNMASAENLQPDRRGSEGTLSQTNASTVTTDTGSRNISTAGGGGSSARKGSKSSDGDQTFGQARSMTYSVARHSPYPAHERHSSGGHTSRSQSVPYSPTETQATSITEDSEDKNHHLHERGGSSTVKNGPPEVVNLEKPGSGHRFDGSGVRSTAKGVDVKTAVLNGSPSGHHSTTDRLVTRKSSRFLNFWKKRAKVREPSP